MSGSRLLRTFGGPDQIQRRTSKHHKPDMSKYDLDYDDYDDDYDDTMEYVKRVKELVKQPKLTNAQIIRKLEETNYNVDKTAAFFKPKDGKVQPGAATKTNTSQAKPPATKGSTTTAPKPVAVTQSVTKPTTAENVPKHVTTSSHTGEAVSTETSTSVFHATNAAHAQKGELALSDDEGDEVAADKSLAAVAASTGAIKLTDETEPQALTMVVSGHVDAGKSTLIGHLLYKCGQVSQRVMHKFEKDSKNIGKASFALAWVTDDSKAEREHGVTIDVSERQLRTEHRMVTILDTPGHRDFIPNMIKGATQADVAILVVPAAEGEFESSMKDNAQTREHATLLKALGVGQILVVINKMDCTVPTAWSESRCNYIEAQIRSLLCDEMHLNEKYVRVVPLSGLTGQNIVAVDEDCALKAWYKGPTLLQAIDSFVVPVRAYQKSLRAVVHEVVSVDVHRGRCELEVSVLQGKLSSGRTVAFYDTAGTGGSHGAHAESTVNNVPGAGAVSGVKAGAVEAAATMSNPAAGGKYTVMQCQVASSCAAALPATGSAGSAVGSADGTDSSVGDSLMLKAGQRGTIVLTNKHLKGIEIGIAEGTVLFKGPVVPLLGTTFKASISTMAHMQPPIIPGTCFELYLHGTETQCRVAKLHSVFTPDAVAESSKAGAAPAAGKRPKCIPGGVQALVSLTTESPVLLESFRDCKALGRFALRARGQTVAVGVCEKIVS